MENKLVVKSTELFKDFEVWESFSELVKLIPSIKSYWMKKYIEQLKTIKKPDTWSFNSRVNGGVWYLSSNKDKEGSMGIWIEDTTFSLWANSDIYDISSIEDLLNRDEFSSLKNLFEDSEPSNFPAGYIFRITNAFQFESYATLDDDQFKWLTGNKPELIIGQLNERLQNFFTPEITELFQKINDSSKK